MCTFGMWIILSGRRSWPCTQEQLFDSFITAWKNLNWGLYRKSAITGNNFLYIAYLTEHWELSNHWILKLPFSGDIHILLGYFYINLNNITITTYKYTIFMPVAIEQLRKINKLRKTQAINQQNLSDYHCLPPPLLRMLQAQQTEIFLTCCIQNFKTESIECSTR